MGKIVFIDDNFSSLTLKECLEESQGEISQVVYNSDIEINEPIVMNNISNKKINVNGYRTLKGSKYDSLQAPININNCTNIELPYGNFKLTLTETFNFTNNVIEWPASGGELPTNLVEGYFVNCNIQAQADTTNANSVNIKTLFDAKYPDLFADWVAKKTKYVLQCFFEDSSAGTGFQYMLASTGLVKTGLSLGSLFSAGIVGRTPLTGTLTTGATLIEGSFFGEPDGSVRFGVSYNGARNTAFFIKSINLIQLYE